MRNHLLVYTNRVTIKSLQCNSSLWCYVVCLHQESSTVENPLNTKFPFNRSPNTQKILLRGIHQSLRLHPHGRILHTRPPDHSFPTFPTLQQPLIRQLEERIDLDHHGLPFLSAVKIQQDDINCISRIWHRQPPLDLVCKMASDSRSDMGRAL